MMSHVADFGWVLMDEGISAYPSLWFSSVLVLKTQNISSAHFISNKLIALSTTSFLIASSCLARVESRKMASITASAATSSVTCTALLPKGSAIRVPPALGLPVMAKMGKVRCSVEGKSGAQESESKLGMSASLLAAACAATMSSPAMALVDERMSTEGTGLPFGLSNNLLGWILFGVFGLIWVFYTIYTGSLDDDEESGLSL